MQKVSKDRGLPYQLATGRLEIELDPADTAAPVSEEFRLPSTPAKKRKRGQDSTAASTADSPARLPSSSKKRVRDADTERVRHNFLPFYAKTPFYLSRS